MEVLADALFGYNGRSYRYGSWRESPYVNNHPRKGRRLTVYYFDRAGWVRWYQDTRPGTLIIYRELVSSTVFR